MYSLLYVDDEPGLLEIGQVFLENTGDFSVTTALSGRAGLEHLAHHDFDAVISDFQMPEMDGIEFLKRVRQSFGNIPFILFTGRGREEIVIQAINHGADFYLQKGGDPKAQFVELAHKVHQAVSRRQTETALSDSEKRLADIIDFLPDATFAIDSKGVVIAWNRAMERMTGIAKADMGGKGNYEYALPFYHERRPILIDLVLEDAPAITARYPFIKKEGHTLVSEITIPHFNNGRGAALWFTASPLYNRKGEVAGAIESIREITERKQAEEALNESERRFRELAELLPQGVYEADTEGHMTYANRLAQEMFGYTMDDVRNGLSTMDMIAPEDRTRAAGVYAGMVTRGIRNEGSVEYLALRRDGSRFPVSIFSSPIIRDGRIEGIRGIIIDITERRRSEERIQESEQNYRLLFDSSPEPILIAQEDRMVHVNPAMAALLGYPAEVLISRPFTDFIHPDDRKMVLSRHLSRMRGESMITGYVFRVIPRQGPAKWVWINSTVFIWSGKPASLNFLSDITERKLAEEKLESANREYRSLLDQIQDVYYRTDNEGRLITASRSWATLFGYDDVSECTGMSLADDFYVNPADRNAVLEKIYREGKITNYEVMVKRKDGTPLFIEASSHLYYDPPGTIAGVEGIFRDITARKRAEEEQKAAYEQLAAAGEELGAQYEALAATQQQLLRHEQQLEEIAGTLPGVVYQFFARQDGSMGLYYVSSRAPEVFGISSSPEGFFERFVRHVDPRDRDAFLQSNRDVSRTGRPWHFEGRFIKPSGEQIWFEGISRPLRRGNELVFSGVLLDISERKRTEESLFNSQQMLQAVLDSIPQRVFWKDRNSVFLGCNKPLAVDSGFSDPAEMVGKTDFDHASHETAELYRADDRQVMESGQPRINYEEPQIRPDGSTAWLRTTKVPLRDKEGAIIGVLGTYEDITERKHGEEALRESEEKYRTLIESSFDGIAIHQNGILVYVNRTAARILGSDNPEIFIGKPALDIVAPAFRKRIVERIHEAPESKQQLLHERFLRVDGTEIDVDVTSTPGTWKGKPAAFVTFRDISEQVHAREALRESEEKYRALVESTSDFIWEVDTAGVYTYVSPQVRQILGYEPEDLLGKTPFAIMPPGEAERVVGEFNRCISSRIPITALENEVRKKDGSTVILETSGTVRTANDGSYQGYRGIDRDITRRKRAEEALWEKTEEINQYFTTSLDLFCIADIDGYFRRLNPEWEKTLGYTIAELEGKRFLDFVHPDDLPATLAAIADLDSQKEVLDFINRYRHKDGTYRWIEWRSYPQGNIIYSAARDITVRHNAAERARRISTLKQDLLRSAPLEEKLKRITDGIVDIFGADFARIWMSLPGDICECGCIHAGMTGGPHQCRNRAHCLHLIVSSGRYTHTDGGHRRVPLGAYKIGRIADGEVAQFITNDVTHDPRVHDHAWAESLGLVSFAGFRLVSPEGEPIGVLAFFSRQPVGPEVRDDLDDMATTASQVIQAGLAEKALRESEARLSSILQGSPVLQFVIDANHRVISWNTALEEYSGVKAAEIIGTDQQWRAFYPAKRPVLADLLINGDEDAISRFYAGKCRESRYVEGAYEATDFFPRMGRSGTWLSFTAAPVRDGQGTVIGAVETLEDITERIRAAQALMESETRYRHIIERLQDAYFRTDREGTLTMVSPSAAVLYRYGSADEMVGIPARTLYYRPEQRAEMLRELEKNGRVTNFVGEALRKDGSVFWASMNSQFITDNDGQVQGTEAVVRDVTELKRMEHAIQEANRKLNLLAGITRHDILNKVSVVLGFLKIAEMKSRDPVLAQYLEKMESAVIEIRSQIEFTRLYENIGTHEPRWIDLETVVPRMQIPEPIILHPEVRGISVFADPMLEKVFSNLLDNSIRHGERVTEIRFWTRRSGNDLVVVWEDNGVGIPADEKERIFERGFGKHTGLGMFLVREILAITGITIRETGTEGRGAIFEITIPGGAFRKAD